MKLNKYYIIIFLCLAYNVSNAQRYEMPPIQTGEQYLDGIRVNVFFNGEEHQVNLLDHSYMVNSEKIVLLHGDIVSQSESWIGGRDPILQQVRADYLEDGILSDKYVRMGFRIWFSDKPFLTKFTLPHSGKHTSDRIGGVKTANWLFWTTQTPLIDITGVSPEIRKQISNDLNKFLFCINDENGEERIYFPTPRPVQNTTVTRKATPTCRYSEKITAVTYDRTSEGYWIKHCNERLSQNCPERCSEPMYIASQKKLCDPITRTTMICDTTVTEKDIILTQQQDEVDGCLRIIINKKIIMPPTRSTVTFGDSIKIEIPGKDSITITEDKCVVYLDDCKKICYEKYQPSTCGLNLMRYIDVKKTINVGYKGARRSRILPENTFTDTDGNPLPMFILDQEVDINRFTHMLDIEAWLWERKLVDCIVLEVGGIVDLYKSMQWRSEDATQCEDCGPYAFANSWTLGLSPAAKISSVHLSKWHIYPSIGGRVEIPIFFGNSTDEIPAGMELSPVLFAEILKYFDLPIDQVNAYLGLGVEGKKFSSFNEGAYYLRAGLTF